jgi:quercetin dioxygenase-like cupin family protein
MHTVDLAALEWLHEAPGLRVAFPIHAATGAAASAAVYFELDPGASAGVHTDSAEEVVIVLEGEAEATVGGETSAVRRGQLAVVPAGVAHDIRNTGAGVARLLGVFASATVVHVFAEAPEPGAPQVFVTGAPVEIAAPMSSAGVLAP